ncbi:hypothetical protein NQ317_015143 [Molorchus minor]|uniref:Spaetzle domain-containing protein n=1 Tax=Molorchus minor TaxID=1323400 RepID=A0ABQ9K6J2_9CUCU|nr:hypothetical protein NQ317_015143 [Molorchus minor]
MAPTTLGIIRYKVQGLSKTAKMEFFKINDIPLLTACINLTQQLFPTASYFNTIAGKLDYFVPWFLVGVPSHLPQHTTQFLKPFASILDECDKWETSADETSLASSEILFNETGPTRRPLKRSAPKPIVFSRANKTKEERILNSSNSGTISFGQYSEQEIIFPDSYEGLLEPIPKINGIPKCSNGSTFCEDFDLYPYHHFKELLEKQAIDKEFYFGKEDIPADLEKRIGIEDDMFLCSGVTREIFPRVAQNKDNEWKLIVNQGGEGGYVQGIRIEMCRGNNNRPCNIIGELPLGYSSVCKQKYYYRRLLTTNKDGTTFSSDFFRMPSACCCSYERNVDFMAARSAAVGGSTR